MRLGLPRALITINHCTLLLLLLLLLPPVAQTAAQFGSLLHRDKTIRAGGLETLQSWFSVVTAGTTGTTSVCSLSFTSDLVTIITSQARLHQGHSNSLCQKCRVVHSLEVRDLEHVADDSSLLP